MHAAKIVQSDLHHYHPLRLQAELAGPLAAPSVTATPLKNDDSADGCSASLPSPTPLEQMLMEEFGIANGDLPS